MKSAVILPPTASSFQTVAGLPLIQRTVLSALRGGFDRVIVVGTQHAEQLHTLFKNDTRTRGVEVRYDLPALDGSAIAVIPSDCVLTTATLARVTAMRVDDRPLLFTSSSMAAMALCRPVMFAGIDLSTPTDGGAKGVWVALQRQGALSIPLDGAVCVRITDARSVIRAEKALCQQLRADTAASDGPLARRIDRHISLHISRWLVRHAPLRPNHLTIVGTCIGLLAAAVLSLGTYGAGVAGTLLFLCTNIIDGCDGEVARLTFQESAFGQKFDVITDNIVHTAIFAGLAIGLYRQQQAGHYVVLMAILLGGFVCTLVVTYCFLVRRPGFAWSGGKPISFKGKVRQSLLQGFEAVMNRDFAYVLGLLALVGRLHWFLWGAAFGTYLFAILLVWIYRWRDTP
jgi:phosphatidylglycerophosphate synthase